MAQAKTNDSMSCSTDTHYCDIQFHSSDLVYLNTAHFSLDTGLSRKLATKQVVPFPIEQVISSVVYCISPPEDYSYIHPVFSISSLYGHQGLLPSFTPPIFLLTGSSQPEYEVEDILAKHVHCGYSLYLIKQLDYPMFENAWEPV